MFTLTLLVQELRGKSPDWEERKDFAAHFGIDLCEMKRALTIKEVV